MKTFVKMLVAVLCVINLSSCASTGAAVRTDSPPTDQAATDADVQPDEGEPAPPAGSQSEPQNITVQRGGTMVYNPVRVRVDVPPDPPMPVRTPWYETWTGWATFGGVAGAAILGLVIADQAGAFDQHVRFAETNPNR